MVGLTTSLRLMLITPRSSALPSSCAMAGNTAPLESASAATPLSDKDRRKERCIEKNLLRPQSLALMADESCSRQFQLCCSALTNGLKAYPQLPTHQPYRREGDKPHSLSSCDTAPTTAPGLFCAKPIRALSINK